MMNMRRKVSTGIKYILEIVKLTKNASTVVSIQSQMLTASPSGHE